MLPAQFLVAQGLRISESIPSIPPLVFMLWCLIRYRDNFTFTLICTGCASLYFVKLKNVTRPCIAVKGRIYFVCSIAETAFITFKQCSVAENMTVGIRHADHVAPSICNMLALTSPTSGSSSVAIVRSRTQARELV
jgi:hypothetical protein